MTMVSTNNCNNNKTDCFDNKCQLNASNNNNNNNSSNSGSSSNKMSPQHSPIANHNSNNNNNGNGNAHNAKMGSRRIFTPQFKLQVLESYRNDQDCKGNQRATARKYNIHRRQIQKWLQCESNLRSSVANINQNNMKHQFHNISQQQHQHQQQQAKQQQLPAIATQQQQQQISIGAAHNFLAHSHHHHHQQQQLQQHHQHHHHLQHQHHAHLPATLQHQLSLEAARQSVALNDTSAAAATAAAIVAAAAGLKAINSNNNLVAPTTPLRPTACCPTSINPHNHAHYAPSAALPYTYTPAPVTLPILTRHISHQQQQQQQQQQQHHLQQHYAAYHQQHLSALTQAKQQSTQQINSLTPTATSAFVPTTSCLTLPVSGALRVNEHNNNNNKNSKEQEAVHDRIATTSLGNNSMLHYAYDMANTTAATTTTAPIDLSLGCRRDLQQQQHYFKHKLHANSSSSSSTADMHCEFQHGISANKSTNQDTNDDVVDLTFRKRKVNDKQMHQHESAEKLCKQQVQDNDYVEVDIEAHDDENTTTAASAAAAEVATTQATTATNNNKPVKLFKPYLLDADEQEHNDAAKKLNEQRAPIIWSNCLSPGSCHDGGGSSNSNSQQTFLHGSPYFPVSYGYSSSSCSSSSKANSPQSALSPTSATAADRQQLRCPKGSPVSGYESSCSLYSEASYCCRSELFNNSNCSETEAASQHNNNSSNNHGSYSLDLKVACSTIAAERQQQTVVKHWLDQEQQEEEQQQTAAIEATQLNSSITLYA